MTDGHKEQTATAADHDAWHDRAAQSSPAQSSPAQSSSAQLSSAQSSPAQSSSAWADASRPAAANLPGLVLTFAADGRIRFANDDARRFLGLTPGSMPASGAPGPSLRAFIHSGDLDRFAALTTALARRAPDRQTLRLRLLANTGDFRVIEGPLSAAAGDSGPELTFVGIDVSHHHRASQQLHTLLEGAGQGLVVHRGSKVLFCNHAMAEMVGLANAEALLAEPAITPFIHNEDLPLVMANIKARLRGDDAVQDYHFRLLSRSGEEIWIDCRASVVLWEGEPAVFASCYNINDRVRAVEAQRQSEQLFTRIFRSSPDFISLSRLEDGVILKVNQSFVDIFGYSEEELIGRNVLTLNLWNAPADRAAIIARLARGEVVQDVELRGGRRDGAMRDFRISAEIIRFEGDDLLLVIGHDISERKRQEAELLASKEAADLANRAKSEFLANMSHELRTPLNAILGFSEIIKNQIHGPLGEPKYVEYASDIHASGSHLLAIINDILDLSKVEAGKLEIHDSAVDFAEVLANCLRLIAPRAQAAGITLLAELAPALPTFLADERLIKQILLNLLSNAIKFTLKGGEIRVTAWREADGAFAFSVRDTGIGMDESGLRRALLPFGQVDSSLSRRHQGSGLGLPLVTAFVERQGGRFRIESAIGGGTTVIITFPPAKVQDRQPTGPV